MHNTDVSALAEAVELLIDTPDAALMFSQLSAAVDLQHRDVPFVLRDQLAVLNPLLALAGRDEWAYDRVIDLVERKRKLAGRSVLCPEHPDRRAYMREFMAVKRDRQRRLVNLLNQLRSANDQIRGTARMELERVHAARWHDEKDRREDKLRKELGRRLTAAERKNVAEHLWFAVDIEMDNLRAFVARESKLPLHARSKTGFHFSVGHLKKDK